MGYDLFSACFCDFICADFLFNFYSFNKGGTMHNFSGFTLGYYKEVFQDTRLLIIVLNTFVIALLSSVIATIIGVCGRWRLNLCQNLCEKLAFKFE